MESHISFHIIKPCSLHCVHTVCVLVDAYVLAQTTANRGHMHGQTLIFTGFKPLSKSMANCKVSLKVTFWPYGVICVANISAYVKMNAFCLDIAMQE